MATTYSVGEVVGSDVYYAGGGGGSGYTAYSNSNGTEGGLGGGGDGVTSSSNSATLQAGGTNTGGGGCGSNYEVTGAAGGSGVIILRTLTSINATFSASVQANGATGANITADTSIAGYKTYVITTAASGETVTFSQA